MCFEGVFARARRRLKADGSQDWLSHKLCRWPIASKLNDIVLLLLAATCSFAQTTINFVPAVVTQCAPNGLGSGIVSWNASGPGPVLIRIGSAGGSALTGASPSQGTALTGEWVADGMVFVLVDGALQELARTTARVKCNAATEALPSALASGSYFPLQVGNEWIYGFNTRGSTYSYVTRRISRAELTGDTVWFVLEESLSGSAQIAESRFRSGDAGRIYQLTAQGDRLWLDPSPNPDPSALLTNTGRDFTSQTPAGVFRNGFSYRVINGGLDLETGTFARGIGLVMNSHDMLSGSSGGFTSGLTLLYAKIDGHIVFTPASNSLELAAEANTFDVSNQATPNCAIPCYFTACGIAGADPAGTYKPCFRATVRMGQPGPDAQSVDLDLLDGSNNSLFHATLVGTAEPESIVAKQVLLYSKPNQPFPAGSYRLRAQTPDGRMSIVPIQLK
jgi:hypothetical protein